MTASVTFSPPVLTVGDLLERLGGISPERVRFAPVPGTATEQDVIDIERRENRLFELVEGVLVEKVIGYRESVLAVAVASALRAFVVPRKLGLVSGSDGMMRLFPGLVRIPAVAFVSRERLPGGHMPAEPIPDLVPDLAVEVLSKSNTTAEMARKRGEYFGAGARLVWLIDPDTRTAAVYDAGDRPPRQLTELDSLDGGGVLPGFALPLKELFAELDL
jgi:Uma2 family endonuclease